MKQINLGNLNNSELNKSLEKDNLSQLDNSIYSNENLKSTSQICKNKKEVKLNTKRSSAINKVLVLLIIFFLLAGIGLFVFLSKSFGSIQPIYNPIHNVFSNCSGDGCQTVKIDNPTCTGIFCSQRYLPQTDGKTNILILGVDAIGDKNGNGQGDADWMLTDVIMVASYNHNTGYLTLISIPRDTEVTYTNYYGNKESTKINVVYSNTGWGYGQKNHERGVKAVSEQVTKITNLPIHYSALVTFTGFKEVIDRIGGVSIDVPNDITDVYPLVQLSSEYKKKYCKTVLLADGYYCQWTLKAGSYEMNGEQALVYARSREKSTDWDRARRQQIVIDSVRKKITSSDTLLNPTKLTDIINSLQNNMKLSSYDANDIVAALELKDKYKGMVSVVLDPNFSPGSINAVSGNSNYRISNLSAIQTKLNEIQDNPAIYKENATIFEYFTGTKVKLPQNLSSLLPTLNITPIAGIVGVEQTFSWSKVVDKSQFPQTSSTSGDSRKPYFYDFTNEAKSETKKLLTDAGLTEIKLLTGASLKNYNDEDFAIIWK